MSIVYITPRLLNGEITPPPSKYACHRAVICAALSKGKSVITPYVPSADITATINAMRALGTVINIDADKIIINGNTTFTNKSCEIDCNESGSTLRFLIPVAAAGGCTAVFTGKGKLPTRPLDTYINLLPLHGTKCDMNGGLLLKISGVLQAGKYELVGNVSSQFITGLLLALPLLKDDSEIRLTTQLESAGYVDMTLDIMQDFGVSVIKTVDGFKINGNQTYQSHNFELENDWSQAAFWITASALGCNIRCNGLKMNSKQRDMQIIELIKQFGADVVIDGSSVIAKYDKLSGIEIDASQIPDLVPILTVVAALSQGTTHIKNAARLRIKESDRLNAITVGLNALGANITELDDGLIIKGVTTLHGGSVCGFNDHRIVMALCIAAIKSTGIVTIDDCESVKKSYPEFFNHYNMLGGCADVVNVG
jgi:3-phosphoshikimate 1-carboxyvinyltransferase